MPDLRSPPARVRVELFSHEGCPLVARTRALLRECLAATGVSVPVIEIVGTYLSPTVLIDGQDVMGASGIAPGVAACRVDPPTREQVLRALLARARRGDTERVDKQVIHDDMDRARASFHQLLAQARPADLARASDGTRWTNQQLLFHMLLGYLIMRALLNLVRVFGRLPDPVSRGWARLLNAATTPFDLANYLGSRTGGALGPRAQAALFDRVIVALHRRLDAETDADLARGMHYPTRWDPFFRDFMTLADVYRFPTQHFEFHRNQLTIGDRS